VLATWDRTLMPAFAILRLFAYSLENLGEARTAAPRLLPTGGRSVRRARTVAAPGVRFR
jgi:hypothetical protein